MNVDAESRVAFIAEKFVTISPVRLSLVKPADRTKAIAKQPPLYGWSQNEIPRPSSRAPSHYSSAAGVLRNTRGRIQRSEASKRTFMRITRYPHGRPGYVVDHIIPLKRGGDDELNFARSQR